MGLRSVRTRELKLQVLTYYSNNSQPQCSCCLESNPSFLTINHVWGDGAEHRREIKYTSIYSWLRARNYPDKHRFDVLCFNCNIAKSLNNNLCPHKETKTSG